MPVDCPAPGTRSVQTSTSACPYSGSSTCSRQHRSRALDAGPPRVHVLTQEVRPAAGSIGAGNQVQDWHECMSLLRKQHLQQVAQGQDHHVCMSLLRKYHLWQVAQEQLIVQVPSLTLVLDLQSVPTIPIPIHVDYLQSITFTLMVIPTELNQ